MRRYYTADLVKDARGRWIPAIKDDVALQEGSLTVVTSDFDANGQPLVPWCLCVVEARDHATLGKKAKVDLLPDFALDSKVGSMHGPTKLAMRAALVARGLPGSLTDNADGYRDIIEGIARSKLNNAGFDADAFNP